MKLHFACEDVKSSIAIGIGIKIVSLTGTMTVIFMCTIVIAIVIYDLRLLL